MPALLIWTSILISYLIGKHTDSGVAPGVHAGPLLLPVPEQKALPRDASIQAWGPNAGLPFLTAIRISPSDYDVTAKLQDVRGNPYLDKKYGPAFRLG